jgi:hypothetical protein
MGFDEPHPSPARSSPTRMSTSGHGRYKERSCKTFTLILGKAVSVYETLYVPNIYQIFNNIKYIILIMKDFIIERIRCTCYVGDEETNLSKFELYDSRRLWVRLEVVVSNYLTP